MLPSSWGWLLSAVETIPIAPVIEQIFLKYEYLIIISDFSNRRKCWSCFFSNFIILTSHFHGILVTLSRWQSNSNELFSRFVKWQSVQINNYNRFCYVTEPLKRLFYPFLRLTKPLKLPWKYLLHVIKIVLTHWYIECIYQNVKMKCKF